MLPETKPLRVARGDRAPRRPSRTRYEDMFLVNCPRCQTPLTIRTGVGGTYYHCRCTKERVQA